MDELPIEKRIDNCINSEIIKRYQSGQSTYQISEAFPGYYPNRINRLLRKMGIKLRTKSDAQKLNLKTGRTIHPTAGKRRSQEVKDKISRGISDTYRSDPNNKEKRSAISRELWSTKSEAEKANLQHKAAVGVRAAADNGSKIELFIAEQLRKEDYSVLVHSRVLTYNDKLEADLFIPELQTVIECDGPTHSEVIYNEESFQKTKRSDAEKNGLLLQHFNVIRLEAKSKKYTLAYARRVFSRLMVGGLNSIIENEVKLYPIESRLILIKEQDSG